MKPMSAIWSASSSTVTATRSSRQSPRSIRSLSRPGRRDDDLGAAAQRTGLPADGHAADDGGHAAASATRAYGVSASVTCWASSRVGTRTSASGLRGSARCPAVRASSASPKARVLPEPVRPRPSTSRPASEFGRVAAWIGNGTVTPRPVSVFSSGAGSSSSANASTAGSAGVRVTGRRELPLGGRTGVRRQLPERPEPPDGRPPEVASGRPGLSRRSRLYGAGVAVVRAS